MTSANSNFKLKTKDIFSFRSQFLLFWKFKWKSLCCVCHLNFSRYCFASLSSSELSLKHLPRPLREWYLSIIHYVQPLCVTSTLRGCRLGCGEPLQRPTVWQSVEGEPEGPEFVKGSLFFLCCCQWLLPKRKSFPPIGTVLPICVQNPFFCFC